MEFDFVAASEQSQSSAQDRGEQSLNKALSSCCREVARAEELLQHVEAMKQSSASLDPNAFTWVAEKLHGLSAASTATMTQGDAASFQNHLSQTVRTLFEVAPSNAMPAALATALHSICDAHGIPISHTTIGSGHASTQMTLTAQDNTAPHTSLLSQTAVAPTTTQQSHGPYASLAAAPRVNASDAQPITPTGGSTSIALYPPPTTAWQGEVRETKSRSANFASHETRLTPHVNEQLISEAKASSQTSFQRSLASDLSLQRSGWEAGGIITGSTLLAKQQLSPSQQTEGLVGSRNLPLGPGQQLVENTRPARALQQLENRTNILQPAPQHSSVPYKPLEFHSTTTSTLKSPLSASTPRDSTRVVTPSTLTRTPNPTQSVISASPANMLSTIDSQQRSSQTRFAPGYSTQTPPQVQGTSGPRHQSSSNGSRMRAARFNAPASSHRFSLTAHTANSGLRFSSGFNRADSRNTTRSRQPDSTHTPSPKGSNQTATSQRAGTAVQKLRPSLTTPGAKERPRAAAPPTAHPTTLRHINLLLRELRGLSTSQIATLLVRSKNTPEVRVALAIQRRAQLIIHKIKDIQLKKLAAIPGLARSRSRENFKVHQVLSERERLARREVRAYLRRLEQRLSIVVSPGSALHRRLTSELTSSDLERLISIIGGARALRGLRRKQKAGKATAILETDISNVFLQELAIQAGSAGSDASSSGDEGSSGDIGEVARGESAAPSENTETQLVADGASPTATLTTAIMKQEDKSESDRNQSSVAA